MPLWSRFANLFRGDRVTRDLDEELASHIEDAIEAGRDPIEARRALGSTLRHREASRDLRILPWLDTLRADAVFGYRQLRKSKTTSAVAILSLGLAFGACLSAFRLVDALLLRPLPIRHPERLYFFRYNGADPGGSPLLGEWCAYPMFQQMRAQVRDRAEMLAVSAANPRDLTFGSDDDMEKPYFQFVSGSMFDFFGISPALGRLFTEADDRQAGAHPYAILSYDYWTRRFARDPNVIGRSFHLVMRGEESQRSNKDVYTVIGVAARGFTGVETGTFTDIFVPATMNPLVETDAWWLRALVILKPGTAPEPVREQLRAIRMANLPPRSFSDEKVLLEPAAPGVSFAQREYRTPLIVLAVLVALVLLVACANVANLMIAQAAARGREMALRVSIGAGRARLVQLVLVEAAILALLASITGGALAWWSAPFVAGRITFRNHPVRLSLPADWRVACFALALIFAVTLLFGLAPALRTSAVKPVAALKGGDRPHFRGRLMQLLVAAQAAFCFLVLFAGGLFVATFERLSHQPTGFVPQRLLALDVALRSPQPLGMWDQVAEYLRTVPGVEAVSLSGSAPLHINLIGIHNVSLDGGSLRPERVSFLDVAPGWFDLMKIPLLAGTGFRSGDTNRQTAIVNQSFATRYFPGALPIGKFFDDGNSRRQIIGVVVDSPNDDIHHPVPPIVYVPFGGPPRSGTFMLRTTAPDPLSIAAALRTEVARARPGFRVSEVHSEEELLEAQTVRERLLATLGFFFGALALLIAGLGLYGVLDYSVLQRRREIGIRIAIGAQAPDIARRIAARAFAMVVAGAAAGLAISLVSAKYVQNLLFHVKPQDPILIAVPWLVLLLTALFATVPAAIRAIRTDPRRQMALLRPGP